MMAKLFILPLLAIAMLTGCDLANPSHEDKDVYLLSVALDYEGTNLNRLEGAVNDQKAMVAQLGHLAQLEGSDFHAVAFTARDGVYMRTESIYTASLDESVSYSAFLPNASMKDRIRDEIALFGKRAKLGDIFIFQYAGHGADSSQEETKELNGGMVVGDIYFPELGDWKDEASNLGSILRIDELLSCVAAVGCERLIILDSCYSGALMPDEGNIFAQDDALGAFKALTLKGDDGNGDLYMLSASTSGELSWEDDQHGITHGLFSAALLEALGYNFYVEGIEGVGRPSDGLVTVSGLYQKLKDDFLWDYQSPQMNMWYTDLVLFTLR